MNTDRILPLTRAVAFLIIPFLVAAFLILFVQGDETGERFAWQIDSRLTAAIIGAGYLGGAYFFLRVGLGGRWQRVAAGFLPVAVYTFSMLLASLIHWNNPFNPGHWPFQVWLALYIITPLLIPWLWWRNEKAAGGTPLMGREVPPVARRVMMGIGALILSAAVIVFIFPALAINIWPWTLTPLTARVLAGWQALLGAGALLMARNSHWSGWPIALQSIGLWQLLVVVAFFLHRGEMGDDGLLNWFVLYTLAGLAGIAGLAIWMNRQPR